MSESLHTLNWSESTMPAQKQTILAHRESLGMQLAAVFVFVFFPIPAWKPTCPLHCRTFSHSDTPSQLFLSSNRNVGFWGCVCKPGLGNRAHARWDRHHHAPRVVYLWQACICKQLHTGPGGRKTGVGTCCSHHWANAAASWQIAPGAKTSLWVVYLGRCWIENTNGAEGGQWSPKADPSWACRKAFVTGCSPHRSWFDRRNGAKPHTGGRHLPDDGGQPVEICALGAMHKTWPRADGFESGSYLETWLKRCHSRNKGTWRAEGRCQHRLETQVRTPKKKLGIRSSSLGWLWPFWKMDPDPLGSLHSFTSRMLQESEHRAGPACRHRDVQVPDERDTKWHPLQRSVEPSGRSHQTCAHCAGDQAALQPLPSSSGSAQSGRVTMMEASGRNLQHLVWILSLLMSLDCSDKWQICRVASATCPKVVVAAAEEAEVGAARTTLQSKCHMSY